MIRDEVTISKETYATLLEKENLGEPHSTLVRAATLWYPPELRHQRDVRVLGELRSQGLVHGARVTDDFMDVLAVMQRPAVEYYTFYSNVEDKRQRTIRTAAIGRDAVLVRFAGEDITITPIPAEQLGIRLAVALPEMPAAQVHSMSCDNADLEAILKDKTLPTTKSVSDARRMKRWFEMDRINVGQFFAAVRDSAGMRRATKAPIPGWMDTESGRILVTPDANGWINLVGADTFAIANALEQLEKALLR